MTIPGYRAAQFLFGSQQLISTPSCADKRLTVVLNGTAKEDTHQVERRTTTKNLATNDVDLSVGQFLLRSSKETCCARRQSTTLLCTAIDDPLQSYSGSPHVLPLFHPCGI